MFKDLIDKRLIDEALAVITVYGPLNKQEIIDYLYKYFSHKLSIEDKENMDLYLESLVAVNRLFILEDGSYSSLAESTIELVSEEMEDIIIGLNKQEKSYDKDELIKYANVNKLNGIKEFDELKSYYDALSFKNEESKDELFLALCFGIYSCFDINGVIKELKKVTNNLNKKELEKHLAAYSSIVPRPFLNGFTYLDVNSMEDTLKENVEKYYEEICEDFDVFFSDKYKIKEKINKKNYGEFSYEDCMKLANIVNNSEIFKLIDSDKVLEFFINGKPVYVSILGYYGKDKAIIIYRSRQEMINTFGLMIDEYKEDYPDISGHVSCIEVSCNNTDFLSDDLIKELESSNIGLMPNFVSIQTTKGLRLINKDETNLVGAVLSDIIKLFQISNLSDIKLNLGETDDIYKINQVYVLDDEVLYGKYNDIEIGDVILPFKLNKVDKKLVRRVCEYEEDEVLIGTYISNCYVEETHEYPHMIIVANKKTGFIYKCFMKPIKDMANIKNEVLELFDMLNINPQSIYVNNDYCFEIFDEFDEYFILDYDEECLLNDIYKEFLKGIESKSLEDSIFKNNIH